MVEDRVWDRLDAVRAELEMLVALRRRRLLSDDENRRYLELTTEELRLLPRPRR